MLAVRREKHNLNEVANLTFPDTCENADALSIGEYDDNLRAFRRTKSI